MVVKGGYQPQTKPHIMKAKRKRHEPEFKARVAIEAMKGIKTIQVIATEYEIHPVQVSDWKKIMTDAASGIFSAKRAQNETEDEEILREKLHAKIGQLTIEIDFLRKKSKQLGL
jgi:transposase-like protein